MRVFSFLLKALFYFDRRFTTYLPLFWDLPQTWVAYKPLLVCSIFNPYPQILANPFSLIFATIFKLISSVFLNFRENTSHVDFDSVDSSGYKVFGELNHW
jgi:hypothetical protein